MAKNKTLSDFRPQAINANQHTERGLAMLQKSVQQDGWIGAITVAADGETFDGSARLETVADVMQSAEPIVIDIDGTRPVIMRRVDIPSADDPRAKRLGVAANSIAAMDYNPDGAILAMLAQEDAQIKQYAELDDKATEAILEAAKAVGETEDERTIGKSGRLYNAGDGHDVEPFKLAYRVEAMYKSGGGKAIELYAGEGQLTAWYRRGFERVVTVDKRFQKGDVDYSMTSRKFIEKEIGSHLDFSFVDFDDEGSPAREILQFLECVCGRVKSFVLCLTDCCGLNLKCRGKFDPSLYLLDGPQRQATEDDYRCFEKYVTGFMEKACQQNNFAPEMISSYRGREGNVVYQTWFISDAGVRAEDCSTPLVDTAASPS